MNNFAIARPGADEFAPYYNGYISLVEGTDIFSQLNDQIAELQNLQTKISDEKALFRYAEGKWSIKELIGHLIDGERVFSYRAMRISRDDQTPLASFEENSYVANSNFDDRQLSDLIEEFAYLRKSNIILFQNMPEAAWSRIGTASDVRVSVRALVYISIGHVRHHLNIINERYLN